MGIIVYYVWAHCFIYLQFVGGLVAKLADFGCAREIPNADLMSIGKGVSISPSTGSDTTTSIASIGDAVSAVSTHNILEDCVGSYCYHSPELLGNTQFYTCAVDLWSLGCCMYEFVLKTGPLYKVRQYVFPY